MALAKERGMVATGTDLDPECVARSSAFGPAEVLDAENPLAQFSEKSFDVVTCFHVLEHVPNPQAILTALGRIARSHLVIAVPNLSRMRDPLRKRNWDEPVNEGHLQSWDHAHFRNLAERHCGLHLVQWGFDTTTVPLLSGLVIRLLGQRAAIRVETGLFRRLWPYACRSIIALLTP
jgi:hypothetical protein